MSKGGGSAPDTGAGGPRGPHLREDAPPHDLPAQRRGVTPQMRGRYPDYDVLESAGHWDEVTRRLVLERAGRTPPIRFFSEQEVPALRALCDVVLAQTADPRVPVLEMVDEKFCAGQLDGFRHHDLPEDPQTWRLVAAHLDAEARARGSRDGFASAGKELQRELVRAFAKGELSWEIPVEKAWSVVTRAMLAAFYSHPWAWNEIGFGGPAYPRGYARLGPGQREHWESPAEFETDPVRDVHERGIE